MARPKKEINWDIVEKRMEAGNSAKKIAKHLRIDINTFYDRFKKEYNCCFADFADGITECGIGDIEFTQHMKALQGNVTMLMYLGKVKCGQKEPEQSTLLAPHQDMLELRHENMLLKAEIDKIKESQPAQNRTNRLRKRPTGLTYGLERYLQVKHILA
jgi:hypothetical protein